MGALARTAAGAPAQDVFGLLRYSAAGPGGQPPTPPPGPGGGPPQQPPTPAPPAQGGGTGTPTSTPTGTPGPGGQPPPPPMPQYDVSADPVLQQVNAAATLADQNAQAAALHYRQQALVGYGDANLAGQILGSGDPYATAAGQNQEGTVQQLLRAYQAGLRNFDTGIDPSLAYSGYRVRHEGDIGQAYQDNLSQAAQAVQAQLGGYTDQLNSQLEADQQQRVQALADAYQRAVQAALAGTGG